MKKRSHIFSLLVVCILAVASMISGIPVGLTQECVNVHNVEISYIFEPGDVYVEPGDCVRFENVHMIEHSAVGLEREFNSGILMPGSISTLRFDEPQVIPYTCGVHPPMVGVIVVGRPEVARDTDFEGGVDIGNLRGDPKAGKRVFNKCKTCHLLEEGGVNRIGPNLFGVIGRQSGTETGFEFSRAMKQANIIWNVSTLYEYLIKPKALVPGTKMAFPGLEREQQIRDVIAYILEEHE